MKLYPALIVSLLLGLTPAPAPGQIQDDQMSCQDDVFALCGEFIPDRDRIVSCLRHRWREVSPRCRHTMATYGQRLKERARVRDGYGVK